ncbi:MAG: LSU ribosomal protein L10p (P0), partial [uncultured Rubrobacteraceae bacterium]
EEGRESTGDRASRGQVAGRLGGAGRLPGNGRRPHHEPQASQPRVGRRVRRRQEHARQAGGRRGRGRGPAGVLAGPDGAGVLGRPGGQREAHGGVRRPGRDVRPEGRRPRRRAHPGRGRRGGPVEASGPGAAHRPGRRRHLVAALGPRYGPEQHRAGPRGGARPDRRAEAERRTVV